MMTSIDYSSSVDERECRRCGICCKKGGPSFHLEDRELIESGIIPLKDLYTIREGERVHDNIKEILSRAETDIIKIKSQTGFSTCIFYKDKGCSIHKNKPIECRILKCWDTREIERMYHKNRLTRKDLLSGIEGLWECVADHQSRCSHDRIHKHITHSKEIPEGRLFAEIIEMMRDDSHLRMMVVEERQTDPEILDFLFGRPLWETIKEFGLQVKRMQNTYRIVKICTDKASLYSGT